MKKRILRALGLNVEMTQSVLQGLTLTAAAFFLVSSASADGYSELHVSLWNNRPFIIELDGKRYEAENAFIVDHLKPGIHSVRLLSKRNESYAGMNGSVGVIYTGKLSVPSGVVLYAQLNEQGKLVVNSGRSHSNAEIVNRPADRQMAGCQNGYGNHDQSSPMFTCSPVHSDLCIESGGWVMLGRSDLEQIIIRLNEAWNDDDRLRIARQALSHAWLRTEDVVELMKVFWFEKNRLELAKFAYQHVSDPYAYYAVNDGFWFSSSVRDLDEYLQSPGQH